MTGNDLLNTLKKMTKKELDHPVTVVVSDWDGDFIIETTYGFATVVGKTDSVIEILANEFVLE